MSQEKHKKQQVRKPEIVSFATRLKEDLRLIDNRMMDLLDASTIERRVQDSDSPLVIIGPEHFWGNTDAKQKKLQLAVKKPYTTWF